jgi:hypothetical protein
MEVSEETSEYAWGIWPSWQGAPDLVARVGRVAIELLSEDRFTPECWIQVYVDDDVEEFASPDAFLEDVTAQALRSFASLTIEVTRREDGAYVSVAFVRKTGEPRWFTQGVLLQVGAPDSVAVRNRLAYVIFRGRHGVNWFYNNVVKGPLWIFAPRLLTSGDDEESLKGLVQGAETEERFQSRVSRFARIVAMLMFLVSGVLLVTLSSVLGLLVLAVAFPTGLALVLGLDLLTGVVVSEHSRLRTAARVIAVALITSAISAGIAVGAGAAGLT